jgi:hypothetical protein
MSQVYKKTERILVAVRSDGKFFGLQKGPATTSPFYTDHPVDAERVQPWMIQKDEPLRDAPYYFENSDRMRRWLKDCRMVWVNLEITATAEL